MKRKLSTTKKPTAKKVELFSPVPDWALEDEHEVQSFNDFVEMERWKVTKSRKTIYILPLGQHKGSACINDTTQLLSAYFQMKVKVMPTMPIVYEDNTYNLKSKKYNFPIASRVNEYGHQQLFDLDILNVLTEFVEKEAYCVLALMDYDIYEWDDTESIIMGRGTGDRVGLLSFYRFNQLLDKLPKTKKNSKTKANAKKNKEFNINESICIDENNEFSLLPKYIDMLAASKTMVHETMHMFGLDHCGYYHCVMNANVSPDDSSIDPIHLSQLTFKNYNILLGLMLSRDTQRCINYTYLTIGRKRRAGLVSESNN
jgi:archaemetzincin